VRSPAQQQFVRLTSLSSCAGCASKLSQALLAELMDGLNASTDPRVLVGTATADDAGVYRLSANRALVQTVDFFMPIVDDPYDYGQIAAANALSDVYAMGGRPLTAMNLLAMPIDKVSAPTIRRILRGGIDKVREAGCALVGGHTIKNPEPVYGLSLSGIVDPRRMLTNATARPGDLLLLTKPLGTGIATTAIKRGLASSSLARKATNMMRRLNSAGADLAEKKLVHCATDVTGFGLLGHLSSMCRASGVSAVIDAAKVPALSMEISDLIARDCIPGGSRANHESAKRFTHWDDIDAATQHLLTDAQTSGGLLLCVAPRKLGKVLELLRADRTPCAAIVGRIEKRGRILIRVIQKTLRDRV
jgi:selenide,water dikinase